MRVKTKKISLEVLLNENLLDKLIGELEAYQDKLSSDFAKAMKLGAKKDRVLPPNFKKDGTDITKIQAAATTAIILGSAIQEAEEATANISLEMVDTRSAIDGDSEDLVKAVAKLYRTIGEELSPAAAWLQHEDLESASRKFSKISDNIEAETIQDTMENLSKSFDEIDRMNIDVEITRMFENPAAKKIIDKDAANDGALSPLVDKALDKMPYFDGASDVSKYLKELPEKLSEIEAFIDEKAKQPSGEEGTSKISSAMFEAFVSKIISETIKGGRKSNGSR